VAQKTARKRLIGTDFSPIVSMSRIGPRIRIFPVMKPVPSNYAFAGVSPVSKNVSIKSSKYQKRLNFRLKVTIFGTTFQYRHSSRSPRQVGEQNIIAPKRKRGLERSLGIRTAALILTGNNAEKTVAESLGQPEKWKRNHGLTVS
jgi:hypothetical protein